MSDTSSSTCDALTVHSISDVSDPSHRDMLTLERMTPVPALYTHLRSMREPMDDASFWVEALNITPRRRACIRWEKDWRKFLKSLQVDDGLVADMALLISKYTLLDPVVFLMRKETLSNAQRDVARQLKALLAERRLEKVWLLLEPYEQTGYVANALENALMLSVMQQDVRPLCPEITVSGLLKERGRPLVNLCDLFVAAENDAVCHQFVLPHEWRRITREYSVGDMCEWFLFVRNEFITCFLGTIAMSMQYSIDRQSGPFYRRLKAINTVDTRIVDATISTKTSCLDKPLIRCENCTKSSMELGADAHFMTCKVCTTKLGFKVYYCSRECQKADWHSHKIYCGKQKFSKGLPGTAGDFWWAYQGHPWIELFRKLPLTPDGKPILTDLGPALPTHPRTPALQRQVDLLEVDKDVDYFLMDRRGRPVPVTIDSKPLKRTFRLMLIGVVSLGRPVHEHLAIVGEYLLHQAEKMPGVGRRLFLKQLTAEYGSDASKVAEDLDKAMKRAPSARGLSHLEVIMRDQAILASPTLEELLASLSRANETRG